MASDETVRSLLATSAEGQRVMTEVVRGLLGPDVTIDEMSFLFLDANSVFNFLNRVITYEGVTLFNYARDTVQTAPIHSAYQAAYWFLTTPGGQYRLELAVTSEGSPLHDPLRRLMDRDGAGRPPVTAMHASFKCPDEAAYGVALGTLRQAGWELLQRCEANYGLFSYWHHPETMAPLGTSAWYLKPRVNLRDGQTDE